MHAKPGISRRDCWVGLPLQLLELQPRIISRIFYNKALAVLQQMA